MRFALPCVPGCSVRLHRDSAGRITDESRDHLLTHTEDERAIWRIEVAAPQFKREAIARTPTPTPALNRAQRRRAR